MEENGIDEIKLKVLSNVLLFLSYRARTTKEIEDRLEKYLKRYKSLDPLRRQDVVDHIFSYLREHKLLDDTEFTRLYIQAKAGGRKPLGRKAIAEKLVKKGIDRNEAIKYLEETISPEDELKAAVNTLERKYPNVSDIVTGTYEDRKMTDKMGKYLVTRGFSYTIARQAVDYLLKRP